MLGPEDLKIPTGKKASPELSRPFPSQSAFSTTRFPWNPHWDRVPDCPKHFSEFSGNSAKIEVSQSPLGGSLGTAPVFDGTRLHTSATTQGTRAGQSCQETEIPITRVSRTKNIAENTNSLNL